MSLSEYNLNLIIPEKKEAGVLEKPCLMYFVGGTGSGKSTVAMAVADKISEMNRLKRIILFSGNGGKDPLHQDLGSAVEIVKYASSMEDIILKISKDGDDTTKKMDNVTGRDIAEPSTRPRQKELMDDITKRAEAYDEMMTSKIMMKSSSSTPEAADKYLMIFDDVATAKFLRSEWFMKFVMSLRHHKTWLLFICQQYHMLPKAIRAQASLTFLWPGRNRKEVEDYMAESVASRDKLKIALEEIRVSRDPHLFLYVNSQRAPSKVFVGFDREITD